MPGDPGPNLKTKDVPDYRMVLWLSQTGATECIRLARFGDADDEGAHEGRRFGKLAPLERCDCKTCGWRRVWRGCSYSRTR